MRTFLLCLGAILLILMWTNPSEEDFADYVRAKERKASPGREYGHVVVISKNYILFSYHECYLKHMNDSMYQTAYAGYGLLNNFALIYPRAGEWKKVPVF